MSIALRPAWPTDAGKTGHILWQFQARTPWMPDIHSAAETVAFCGQMIDDGWVTVALLNQQVVGFLARDAEDICALYLLVRAEGQGFGKLLLNHAKSQSARLSLRAFQANSSACQFYEREGFVEMARGDGRDNDENLHDVHYVWSRETRK